MRVPPSLVFLVFDSAKLVELRNQIATLIANKHINRYKLLS